MEKALSQWVRDSLKKRVRDIEKLSQWCETQKKVRDTQGARYKIGTEKGNKGIAKRVGHHTQCVFVLFLIEDPLVFFCFFVFV